MVGAKVVSNAGLNAALNAALNVRPQRAPRDETKLALELFVVRLFDSENSAPARFVALSFPAQSNDARGELARRLDDDHAASNQPSSKARSSADD